MYWVVRPPIGSRGFVGAGTGEVGLGVADGAAGGVPVALGMGLAGTVALGIGVGGVSIGGAVVVFDPVGVGIGNVGVGGVVVLGAGSGNTGSGVAGGTLGVSGCKSGGNSPGGGCIGTDCGNVPAGGMLGMAGTISWSPSNSSRVSAPFEEPGCGGGAHDDGIWLNDARPSFSAAMAPS